MDKDLIDSKFDDNNENSEYIEELVNNLVDECCSTLDEYIYYVKQCTDDSKNVLTDQELDDIIISIPSMLYFVGTQQEKLGIKRDVSETARKQMYNKIFSEMAGTASDKKAKAELELFNEDIITLIYKRAYEIIHSKVEFATEILQSAKKISSRRIAELELSRMAPNKFKQ